MASAVFAEHQILAHIANIYRPHDFVSGSFFEHAILMNACLMGECVLPNDCFVALYLNSRYMGDKLTGGEYFFGVDVGFQLEVVLTGFNSHHNFFKGAVSSAFTNTIDGAFDLSGTF
jgi:hypothetical protein